jgi:rhamnulokinase/L-fuculokinase
MIKAKEFGGFDSIGIDTWGVDFGLLRKDGTLVENPVHYRDKRNSGMIEKSQRYISKERMYDITGIQFMDFNTVFQLLSLKENRPYILDEAETMLFTPDLLNYMLTGVKSTEYSIATTSQMVDLKTNDWSDEIITCNYPSTVGWIFERFRNIVNLCNCGDIITDIQFESE